MNYTSRYGLEFNPFIKNSKEILVETGEYKEICFRLNYLTQTKGFGMITGGAGRGKTTAIRNWIQTLNKAAYKVIYISLSTLTVTEFYRQLAVELGIEPYHKKSQNFKAIQETINRYEIEKRITPVIILDEANYMRNSILNDLKILFNFDMDSKDRAVVVLVGLPNLQSTLRLNVHEPLRQRIIMNYTIEELNKIETQEYIKNKLAGAGCHNEVFDRQAYESIINASNGIPRIINKICNSCLLLGNNENKNIIDSDIVLKAVNDIEI